MKTYKPNNSTLLYLNSSFNCTKSSSVTVTKSGNASGSSPPPKYPDIGKGVSATIPGIRRFK